MADKKTQNAQIEEAVLLKWEQEHTFAKSVEQRAGNEVFSFYDGPPFANGLPHFGHTLVTSIKDSLGRYKTMRGYYVERRNGWDCHGLPVEFAIEKQFGVSGKKQILELGLEKFNQACRESVFTYKADWEDFFLRVGRWTDTQNAYASIDRNYTESVWWTFKQVNDKGLLYKGYKSMPYCPRCETPLSNFELNEGYQDDVTDPSLYVKFKLNDEAAFLLGWTTTPWSLPGNAAIAVKPDEHYVYADYEGQTLVLAKKRLEAVFANGENYTISKEVAGSELVGRSYEPLYVGAKTASLENADNLYKVWPAEFVSIDDGTGVLHVAPAFGEDDLNLGLTNHIPVLTTVDTAGKIRADVGFDEVTGMFFKKADKVIIEDLTKRGLVYAAESFQHTYPFCYRCGTPLFYYAINTWFIKVSAIKDRLLATAADINWTPAHIKDGRFGKWLEGARDWAISRNRYWGAPMPVWANVDDADDYIVVGSIDELRSLAGDNVNLDDLHRPYIDDISFTKDGKTYKRVEEVLDCWFESGSMPVAQQHFPFENNDKFEVSFPADYIGEGLDQTRLWFYVQHVISTILFDKPAYKNVLVNGMIMAADGQKLSKRLKNYPPVDDVFDTEGADSLRLYLLSNNQAVNADYMRFNRDGMKDINRNVLGTLLNSYRFFKMYADIDKWTTDTPLEQPNSSNVLDQWMLARLNATIDEVTKQADAYKLARAISPVFLLIDDMSNWFIRRSRRRFWKSEDDNDKAQAYAVLHYTLLRVCQLLAPWAPFVSEHVYSDLMNGESVHLSDWPIANGYDQSLIDDMQTVRDVIAQGLAQRAQSKIKVRQPLNSLDVPTIPEQFEAIVMDEVNVKQIVNDCPEVKLDTTLSDVLLAEGLMRDIVRQIQSLRKTADLQVDDRIILNVSSNDSLVVEAVEKFGEIITKETLATTMSREVLSHSQVISIDGHELTISLQAA